MKTIQHSVLALLFSASSTFAEAPRSHKLVASPHKHPLLRQSSYLSPSFINNHIYYSEEATVDSHAPSYLSANITLEPYMPTILLDHAAEHYSHISCADDAIQLKFADEHQLELARQSWTGIDNFVVVTSQRGCALDGEHQAFVVSKVEYLLESDLAILHGHRESLRSCNRALHVHIDRHERPRAVAPRDTDTGPKVVGFDFVGQIIPLANKAVEGALTILGAKPPDNLVLSCTECSATATFELTTGHFSLGQIFDDHWGTITFSARDMRGKMAVDMAFLPGFKAGRVEPQLPSIPLPSLNIFGILDIGPAIDLKFPIEVDLNSPVNISTGFSLEVPDSSIVVYLGDLGESHTTGFTSPVLTPLPLDISDPSLSFSVIAGFRPELNFVASILGFGGSAGGYLDLPKLITNITSLDDLSSTCECGPSGDDIGPDAVRIVEALAIEGGLEGEFDALLFTIDGSTALFSKVFPATTTCVSFEPGMGGLVPSTPTPTSKSHPQSPNSKPSYSYTPPPPPTYRPPPIPTVTSQVTVLSSMQASTPKSDSQLPLPTWETPTVPTVSRPPSPAPWAYSQSGAEKLVLQTGSAVMPLHTGGACHRPSGGRFHHPGRNTTYHSPTIPPSRPTTTSTNSKTTSSSSSINSSSTAPPGPSNTPDSSSVISRRLSGIVLAFGLICASVATFF